LFRWRLLGPNAELPMFFCLNLLKRRPKRTIKNGTYLDPISISMQKPIEGGVYWLKEQSLNVEKPNPKKEKK